MPPIPQAPSFVLVKSTNPHRDGQYGRLGLRFSRAWRALQVDPSVEPVARLQLVNGTPDPTSIRDPEEALADNRISQWTRDRLDGDPCLALKPATQAEIDAYLADQAASSDDKDSELAELRKQNADLETRLMKLELAASGKPAKSDAKDQPKG